MQIGEGVVIFRKPEGVAEAAREGSQVPKAPATRPGSGRRPAEAPADTSDYKAMLVGNWRLEGDAHGLPEWIQFTDEGIFAWQESGRLFTGSYRWIEDAEKGGEVLINRGGRKETFNVRFFSDADHLHIAADRGQLAKFVREK